MPAPTSENPPAPAPLLGLPRWEPAIEVRGGPWLRKLESVGHSVDRLIQYALPASLNPLAQLGAVANTCFLVALGSGILLLGWYSPSVHQAWASLEAMRVNSFLGSLTRSLHRYSSDACVLFILLHAVRVFLARRFTGPRWLAWSTGVGLLALIWAIGWSGYWLVWDVGAQHAALGTAKFIDRLPLLTEPWSRSFLTNESVPSLLFFVIFFAHMLGPLGVGLGLWIHLQRVNRARLFTARPLTLWITGSLLGLSLLAPATSGPAADMLVKVERFSLDGWYLWPLALTDRISGGLLWLVFLGTGLAVTTIPWWLARRRVESSPAVPAEPSPGLPIATVDLARCFGCTLCAKDCPFNAITMVSRGDGRKFAVQSSVDPDLCVACGVCAGACDSDAINLPIFNSREVGKTLNEWLETDAAAGRPSFLALLCAEAAGGGLPIDSQGRCPELPGYRVSRVPCVGWISSGLLERALQHGASGVLIAGCAEGDPNCREGNTWLRHRLEGHREPALDGRKADRSQIHFLQLDAGRSRDLITAAASFRDRQAPPAPAPSTAGWRWVGALSLTLALGGLTLVGSRVPYRTPHDSQPALVVSFNHSGQALGQKYLSAADAAKRLPHMRQQVNLTRERVPVRLRVTVDGVVVHEQSYPAKGFAHDGPSLALERLPVTAGRHQVLVEMADTLENEWPRQWRGEVVIVPGQDRVLLFATQTGFTWHGAGLR
jgi:ferredoxin/coenzyme F420-reducing hydrogenase delta subunit